MSEFPGLRCPIPDEEFTEKIKVRQRAIQKHRLKLEEVKRQRQLIEQETFQCYREAEQRARMIMTRYRVIDELEQLSLMLQVERDLSEQLNGQASEYRNQKRDLEESRERLENIEKGIAAEIADMKNQLAEAKAHNMAAEALIN